MAPLNRLLLVPVTFVIASGAFSLGSGSTGKSTERQTTGIPSPAGIYVLDDASE